MRQPAGHALAHYKLQSTRRTCPHVGTTLAQPIDLQQTHIHQDYFIVISLLRYLLRCLFARALFEITAIYIFIILCLYEMFLFSLVLFRYNVSEMFMQCTCCIVVMSGGVFLLLHYILYCLVYNGCLCEMVQLLQVQAASLQNENRFCYQNTLSF